MLQGALRLLCDSCAEDVLQQLVHLAHPAGGWCRQCIEERSRCGHVLASPREGGEQPLHCHRLACLELQFVLAQVSQHGLNSYPLVGKVTSLPCGISDNDGMGPRIRAYAVKCT
jgi:hypothetical protein